jgi:nucleoside-diphosphate-sugar epimerase
MRVLVTGSSGGVGRYVVEELKGHHEVVGYDLAPPPEQGPGPAQYVQGDILDMGALTWAMQGVEGVVHLAAIPNPLHDPPARVIQMNVSGTYRVLEAARLAGVGRVVIASSDSTLGFVFRQRDFLPERLPIDEGHPLRPQDAYSLSKVLSEEICWAYGRATDMEAIALRICHILLPGRIESYRGVVSDSSHFARGLWVYTHVQDAARAFRLALEVEGAGSEALFIAAKDLLSRERTLELVEEHYPGVEEVDRERLQGHSSLIDCQKAQRVLGYESWLSWRDFIR